MFSLCLSLVYSHCCEGVSSRKGGVGDLRSAVPYRDVTSQIYRWCTASPLVSCPPSIFPPSFSLSCFCFNGFHAFCQSQKTYKTVRHRPFFNVVKNQYQHLVVSLLFLFKDYLLSITFFKSIVTATFLNPEIFFLKRQETHLSCCMTRQMLFWTK